MSRATEVIIVIREGHLEIVIREGRLVIREVPETPDQVLQPAAVLLLEATVSMSQMINPTEQDDTITMIGMTEKVPRKKLIYFNVFGVLFSRVRFLKFEFCSFRESLQSSGCAIPKNIILLIFLF